VETPLRKNRHILGALALGIPAISTAISALTSISSPVDHAQFDVTGT
jgi:hypothetical protein